MSVSNTNKPLSCPDPNFCLKRGQSALVSHLTTKENIHPVCRIPGKMRVGTRLYFQLGVERFLGLGERLHRTGGKTNSLHLDLSHIVRCCLRSNYLPKCPCVLSSLPSKLLTGSQLMWHSWLPTTA